MANDGADIDLYADDLEFNQVCLIMCFLVVVFMNFSYDENCQVKIEFF